MTHRVRKSVAQYLGDFPALVEKHATELSAWTAHMKRVEVDAANPKLRPDEKHAPYPRPTAPADVELSIGEGLAPDFEIEDDGPTPDQILSAKKNALFNAVSAAEAAAIDAVTPLAKRRFLHIREAEIRRDDLARQADVLAKNANAGALAPEKLAAAVKKLRCREDNDFVAQAQARQARIDAIIRAAAKMHHDIDDLTIDTVNSWTMPPFEG